jgi:hypothetical protein
MSRTDKTSMPNGGRLRLRSQPAKSATSHDRPKQSDKSGYRVGNKRPPLETRFKKGKSGNPRGRPRKPRTLDESLLKLLEKSVPGPDGKRVQIIELIARRQVDLALKGDRQALKHVKEVVENYHTATTQERGQIDPEELAQADEEIIEAFKEMVLRGDT